MSEHTFAAAATTPVVLALHSLGLHGGSWARMTQHPALQDVRWLTPDLPGHGLAAAPPRDDLSAYVTAMLEILVRGGHKRVHVLGHSMGGAVGALLAARCAADASLPQVLSLTVLASPAQGMAQWVERGELALSAGMAAAAAQTLPRWFGEASDRTAYPDAEAALLAMSPAGFAAAWRALAGFAGYAALVDHLPDTLVVAGHQDLSTPPARMQDIVAAFTQAGRAPACAWFTVDGGHMFPLTPDDALAQRLRGHWRATSVFESETT